MIPMLKEGAKLRRFVFFCLLCILPAKTFSQAATQKTAGIAPPRLSLAEAYACTLNVWNRETRPGSQDVKLTEFRLRVEAVFVEQDSAPKPPVYGAPRFRFWLRKLDLQYLPGWQLASEQQGGSATRSDWHKLKIRVHAGRELPLTELTAQDTLAQIDIHSTIAMSRNDLMRLGVFNFHPGAPGLFELRFQLERGQRVVFQSRQRLEFYCPPERLHLTLARDGALHEVGNSAIYIPLVASTFFEPQTARPNQNETDRLFRSIFWGYMAKRLACDSLPASLLALDDFTSGLDAATRLRLAQERAECLLQTLTAVSGQRCAEKAGSEHEHASAAGGSACRHAVSIRSATPAETRHYIKANESQVSPQWFAEENRVAPLVASPEIQRLIFAPIALKPLEQSDYIEFSCSGQFDETANACWRGGVIEVTNAAGAQSRQEIAPEVLRRAVRGQGTLRLDAPEMNAFLTAGEYTAILKWPGGPATGGAASNAVRFRVTRKQIVRDEVFALSPYDRVELTYELDRERVSRISRDLINAMQNEASPPEVLVLITGHSDSLGEHRAEGMGRNYNLGLSFGRALHLKKIFLDSLAAFASQKGFQRRTLSRRAFIPVALMESVRKHLSATPASDEALPANGSAAHAAAGDDVHENYLSLVFHEKARHFNVHDGDSSSPPSAREILSRCAALRSLIPMEISQNEILTASNRFVVTAISAGLGAAVPFYRQLELSGELQEILCRMGYLPAEMPRHLFGKDNYPAGRLMNRRVELNVIW